VRAAKLNAVGLTAVFALSLGGLASAQTTTNHWTVDSAETVGTGANVLRGQVGFPGFVGDFIHGLDPTFDIGGRMWLNYAIEGITNATHFEWKIQLTLRKQFLDTGKIKLAGVFDPGFLLYTGGGTTSGITFPIGVQLGIPIDPKVTINASFDIPFWVTFGTFSSFHMPLLFGGGVEYLLEPNLALTFKLRLGPDIGFGDFATTNFAFNALFGVAYKL
jgi:hypothetical protein